MTFAKGLNWISAALAVGAIGAFVLDFPVWWGAGGGVLLLIWFYFKKDDEDGGSSAVSELMDAFDGD